MKALHLKVRHAEFPVGVTAQVTTSYWIFLSERDCLSS